MSIVALIAEVACESKYLKKTKCGESWAGFGEVIARIALFLRSSSRLKRKRLLELGEGEIIKENNDVGRGSIFMSRHRLNVRIVYCHRFKPVASLPMAKARP